jgi:hypothetical protein
MMAKEVLDRGLGNMLCKALTPSCRVAQRVGWLAVGKARDAEVVSLGVTLAVAALVADVLGALRRKLVEFLELAELARLRGAGARSLGLWRWRTDRCCNPK